jgi:prolipoprotein diacylglyceryltransferase
MACGLAGFVAGSAFSLVLAAFTDATVVGQLVPVVAGAAAFVVVVWVTDALTGTQSLTFYHDALAVLAASALATAVLGLPVLAHLDITAAGLMLLLAWGRVGCTLVGCCHGRPARRGIVYDHTHVRYGLAPHLVGRMLRPVPLYEAGAATALAITGAVIALAGAAPGTAFAAVLAAYALIRTALEELRGDWQRPRLGGVSEPQITSALVIAGIAIATLAGVLPDGPQVLAPLVLLAAAGAIAAWRHGREGDLLEPGHLRELVRAAHRRILVTTSRGVRVSSGVAGGRPHVTLSALPPDDDAAVAGAVADLCLPRGPTELLRGTAGVVHVLGPSDG